MARILLADDQRDVLEALRILLKSEGYLTEGVTSLTGIFNALEKKEYALLLMDLNYTRDTTSGQEGLAAIVKIQEIDPTLPIVVMTAWATIELAVEAMKRGARDFVTKPWDNQRLLTIVRTQIELGAALRRERKLEAENELLRGTIPDLIAQSPTMRPVVEMISRVAPSDANVLITGENGTGKSLIAQAIHALSPRASRTMSGVLQQLPVQIGQRVKVGDNLARVADPTKLKAQVKIAETQAKDIQIGQKAVIDTRNGVANGHVTRVDPAVEQGTVNVEVAFDEALPKGARPDLSVDGTIELEHLDDVIYVGRPAFGQENNTVGMFKIVSGTSEAVRTPVKLGKSSVNTIQIVDGLQPGDQVILSDTSAWDAHDRIRLN